MPTADATLLPPPFRDASPSFTEDEPSSGRSLDAIGVGTVLGAMLQHRRASQPSFSSIVVPSDAEPETLRNLPDHGDGDEEDERRAPAASRATATSDVFLKAR